MKVTFIGGGNMAEAMLSALLKNKLARPAEIRVSDIAVARLAFLKEKYGTGITSDNRFAVKEERPEVVILAIKPQNLAAIMTELKDHLQSSQLILSIIAGARIDTLRSGLAHNCIVRVMPNTPAQIGEGVSVWTATPEVSEQQKKLAASILGVMGQEFYVDDEKYLDMVTAISGSGPAYVFLFMESLLDAAVHIGIPQDLARQLVLQTVVGSSRFAQQSDKSLAELRRMVTSPGGTTAEAIAKFEQGNFSNLILQAVVAAYEKAQTLGK